MLLVLSLLSLLFASSLLLPAGLIEVHWNVHGSDPSLSSVVVTAGGAVAVPTSLVSDDLMEDLYRLEGTAWVGRETVAPCVVWHRGVWSPFIVRGVEPVFWRRVPHVLSNSSPLGLGSCFVGVRTGLAVGERLLLASSFTADVVEVEVVGVVATGMASLDHQIYVPREVANLLRGIHSRLSSCVRVGVNASVVSPLLYRQVVEAPHLVVVRVTGVGDPRHVVVGVSYHGSYAEFETNIFGYAVLQLPFGNYTFRCGNLSERRFLVEPVTEVVFDGPEGFVRRAPQPVFFWWESEAFYNFDRVLDRLQITSLSAGSVYTSRVFGDLRVFLVTLAVVILATVGMNVSGLLAEVVTKNREQVKTLFILGGRLRQAVFAFLVPLLLYGVVASSLGYVVALLFTWLLTDVLVLNPVYWLLTVAACTGLGAVVIVHSLRSLFLTASLLRQEIRELT